MMRRSRIHPPNGGRGQTRGWHGGGHGGDIAICICHQLFRIAMTTENAKKPNGQIIAAENELFILGYLHQFGWLRTRDLASLGWPGAASTESAISMAQRTLKRLKDSRQVLHKLAPDGATVYALALSGAKRLNEEWGTEAHSGKDLLRELGNYEHRCAANQFAINRILTSDQKVWTEREIQSGQAPIRTVIHKVPDGLVDITEEINREFHFALAWVEIERGYKNNRDFNKMMHFAFDVLGFLDSTGRPSSKMYEVLITNVGKEVNIGEVIIQVANAAQRDRIIEAVRNAHSTRPYDYGWQHIFHNLYLCTSQSAALYRIGPLLGFAEDDAEDEE